MRAKEERGRRRGQTTPATRRGKTLRRLRLRLRRRRRRRMSPRGLPPLLFLPPPPLCLLRALLPCLESPRCRGRERPRRGRPRRRGRGARRLRRGARRRRLRRRRGPLRRARSQVSFFPPFLLFFSILLSLFLSCCSPRCWGSLKLSSTHHKNSKPHEKRLKTTEKNRGSSGSSDDGGGGGDDGGGDDDGGDNDSERFCCCCGGDHSGSEEARGSERGLEAADQRGVGVLNSSQGKKRGGRERFYFLFFFRDWVQRERDIERTRFETKKSEKKTLLVLPSRKAP